MLLQTFARNMRAAPTDAEAVIWRQLRAHRFAGHKFRRQQPIGNYILDFVCFEAKLIVEVEGGQHNGSISDRSRDQWLESQGFLVLRFWNNEVFQNLEGVLSRILEVVAPSPSIPPPRGGREEKRSISCTASKINASLPPRGGGTEGEAATTSRMRIKTPSRF